LQFYDDEGVASKEMLSKVLAGCLGSWLLLNIAFFCIFDMSFLGTFFGKQTAPQYTCEYFLTSTEDYQRWDAVFENRISYTKSIHCDVKVWVAANIRRWQLEKPDFFNIELISDEFLPAAVIEAEGGKNRRRSTGVTMQIMGGAVKVHPVPQ